MKPERIRIKAAAIRRAWFGRYGSAASDRTTILALCPAIHETGAGDSWPGPDGVLDTEDDEHNWGATTLRPLNAAELSAVRKAGLAPTVGPGHQARARAAQVAIELAGLPLPQGNIHCDSSPAQGPYFVWFAAFDTPEKGANYYLRLLCERKDGSKRPAHSILLDPHGTVDQLARAMYGAGYYTGFHKPADVTPAAKVIAAELNIGDYARALRGLEPQIDLALRGAGWPLRRTLRMGSSGRDVAVWQKAVGAKPDGVFGPRTAEATRIWQLRNGLKPDAIVGSLTWAKATTAGILDDENEAGR